MADSLEKPPRASVLQSVHHVVFLVFLLAYGATFILIASGISSPLFYPLLVTLLLSTFATTLLSLGQTLPAQNILAIVALLAVFSGLIEFINLKTHFPFGHRFWADSLGPLLFHCLPWPVPLICVIVLLNSRGAARTLLGFRPNLRLFGLWSLALSSLFAALFDACLEHFANTNQLWFWSDTKGVPRYNFFAWVLISAAMLILITPWLINKKPVPKSPPDYVSLTVWILLQLLLVM